MKNTTIEWCDHTWNPWIGCSPVSEGCANCYAAANRKRWGKDFSKRERTSEAYWKQPLRWQKQSSPGHWWMECPECRWRGNYVDVCPTPDCLTLGSEMESSRPRVFPSMCDPFDPDVPKEWRLDFWHMIVNTRNLDWLILTKRPEFARKWLTGIYSGFISMPPLDNLWLGVSCENQEQADNRIPVLLQIPAKVKFISCEPLLGPVDLRHIKPWHPLHGPDGVDCLGGGSWGHADVKAMARGGPGYCNHSDAPRIDWVICGGESGPKARPMHPDWVRSLRDQCKNAGVPFMFKQMGGKRKPFPEIPLDLRIKEFPI